MPAGATIFNVLLGLLVLALVAALGAFGYLSWYAHDIKVGALVQTTFTGNPAMLMTALLGPKGELEGHVAPQDALNALYCDVPGSAGAYSSWFTSGGANAQYNAYAQASYTTHMNSAWSCSTDAECAAIPWNRCGTAEDCWAHGRGTATPDGIAEGCCGSSVTAGCSFSDTASMAHGVCTLTDKTDTAPGVPKYTCSTAVKRCQRSGGAPSGVTQCGLWGPAGCGSVPDGACNVSKGYCQVDSGEHVLINTQWLAEGVVTGTNSDGSANVAWQAVRCLYAPRGPSLPWQANFSWDYGQCRFIAAGASADASPSNAAVAAMLLGSGAADGMSGDPAGLPTASSAASAAMPLPPSLPNVWAAKDPVLGYGWMGPAGAGLPLVPIDNISSSAWGLRALSVPKKELKRVRAYTITPVPDAPAHKTLLGSMTAYRAQYMGDRPPHLQIHTT